MRTLSQIQDSNPKWIILDGDLDANWEDVNESGSETVAGDNPTPDQSLVEENASAIGVSYEDNEELEFIDKI